MKKYEKLKSVFSSGQPVKASVVRAQGIPTQALVDFRRKGKIRRITRGVYIATDAASTENTDYELAALTVPNGVLCLFSALRFHGLTVENPHELHIAIKANSRYPKIDYPPVVFYSYSNTSYSFGIETHDKAGVLIKVYSVAKTIADCFKYRNKIGLDVAIASLKEGIQAKMFSYDELWEAAKICRVSKVIRPYIEAVS
jgi:predicted transcriptional regulator of viral defense system